MVAQHQDPQDHQHIAGPVHPDRHHTADPALQDLRPTAGRAHPDRHLTADPAAEVHIQEAAGQADHQDLIPVAADRRVAVLHHTQAAVPGQAVRAQVAREDNNHCPG